MKYLIPEEHKAPHCRGCSEQRRKIISKVYSEQQSVLRRFAKKKGLNLDQSLDLVSDAFTALIAKMKDGTWSCDKCGDECCGEGMRRYLATVVSRRSPDYFDKPFADVDALLESSQLPTFESAEEFYTEAERDLEVVQEKNLFNRLLLNAIYALIPIEREVILQQYATKETIDDLSARLGKTRNHIYGIRKRAKANLADSFKVLLKDGGLEKMWHERQYAAKD